MSAFMKMPLMAGIRSWSDAARVAATDPEASEAVMYFRRVLGEDWAGWDERAQLACTFGTGFQGGTPEGVRLHRIIRALDGDPTIDLVVRQQLGSSHWSEFVAGEMTLEFLASCRGAGCATALLQNDHRESPDSRIKLVDRWITTEFKALHDRDDEQPWSELFDYVVRRMDERGSDAFGLEVEFTEASLSERDALVDGLLAVKEERSAEFRELPRGTGRARMAKDGERSSWRKPLKQKNDLERLLASVGKWAKQLKSAHEPTVVVVRTKDLFPLPLLPQAPAIADAIGRHLMHALLTKKPISAVLAYDEPFFPALFSACSESEAYRLAIGSSPSGHHRAAVLVANPAARKSLTAAECRLLVGPGMIW